MILYLSEESKSCFASNKYIANIVKEFKKQIELSKEDDDAVYALLSLGFTKSECVDAVKKAKEQGANSIEQIISFALKNIR